MARGKTLAMVVIWYLLYIIISPGLFLNLPAVQGQDTVNNPFNKPTFQSNWLSVAVHGVVYLSVGMLLTGFLKKSR